jgi:rare lipoprotein A
MRLGPSADTSSAPPPAPSSSAGSTAASASPAPSAAPDRPADRAGRSGIRSAPSPAPSTSRSQPSGGGPVTTTGTCKASYYATGQRTASGEPFDPNAFTAAHKTLPFNTRVRVTNLANGKSVVVRVNDRGPFVASRCLDLARAAFAAIASLSSGVANVRYEVLG